jgi:hypothetical protein
LPQHLNALTISSAVKTGILTTSFILFVCVFVKFFEINESFWFPICARRKNRAVAVALSAVAVVPEFADLTQIVISFC